MKGVDQAKVEVRVFGSSTFMDRISAHRLLHMSPLRGVTLARWTLVHLLPTRRFTKRE
jgi:hypothetical protein